MARTIINALTSYSEVKEHFFSSLDVKDEKGRAIGCRVRTRSRTITEVAEGEAPSWSKAYSDQVGTYYGVELQKTKDGKAWGASQPTKFFSTEEEAKAYWVAKVADRIADNWK